MRSMSLSCAIGLACLTMFAQTKTRTPQRTLAKPTQQKEVYSNTEFDPTASRLPAGFNGHDIQRLLSALEEAESGKKKGEFESTEQWMERLRLAEASPISGTLTRNSTYAFVIGQNYSDFSSGVKIVYDADRAKFDVSTQAEPPIYLSERAKAGGALSLPVWTTGSLGRAYIATNGFGAVREVTEYTSTEYKLIIANNDAMPFIDVPLWKPLGFREIRGEVFILPALAREVKSQIRLVAVCKLAVPYVTSGWLLREATLDNPVSRNIDFKYLNVNLLAIWLYNHETGAVYARIHPSPQAPQSAPPPSGSSGVQRIRVGGNVQQFNLLRGVHPVYPP